MTPEVLKILAQIVISFLMAFLAAKLATNRYRKDKVWDQKMLAYSQLIEALHEMKWPLSEHQVASLEGRELSDDISTIHWDNFRKARKDVYKIAESSSFIVSEQVQDAIANLEVGRTESNRSEHWQEALDVELYAINKCIEKVKKIASDDLNVKNSHG